MMNLRSVTRTIQRSNIRCFSTSDDLSTCTPEQIIEKMKKYGLHRAYLVYDKTTKKIQTSHPMFDG
jgi:hypothetical protein